MILREGERRMSPQALPQNIAGFGPQLRPPNDALEILLRHRSAFVL